ncbi:hypothetical protein J3Q64DRAFT_1841823 [Phycomyces blakesleeanus]|uniref:BOD1/SHG1 domain-containing protein n=2 Tax=Phycomyces blakesleeanus TaxID=4837 RepID=A0A162U151_PHYB8|nr:hypothetical protein PHYBLDRAFT_147241 [Phycomyces blakesleeanus NRRL 1555(-)]OAD71483.1 hypothetical protein PHYBLDRAFT_147241 [Phycomyces blakesleeanus NRRL 1555(-)]|eukprot:XP_018289523.1 hypothetical protein PHYBLDRAFT_147241 [Phycomyces blakesleeanus NRRL 1555(-)]
MTPEDVVLQLKRKGTFDSLRKRLLSEFQSAPTGQSFLENTNGFMEDIVKKDDSLLDKDRTSFYEHVTTELERAKFYDSIREEILETLLKDEYYQKQVDDAIENVMSEMKPTSSTVTETQIRSGKEDTKS